MSNIHLLERLGIAVGYRTTHTGTITEEGIELFAKISGDYNPLHVSEEYARKTMFGGRIAHGVMVVSFLSAAMAKFPAVTVLLSHSSKFKKPAKIGDTVTAVAEVTAVRQASGILTLKNTCTNQDGETLVEGETVLRLFEPPA